MNIITCYEYYLISKNHYFTKSYSMYKYNFSVRGSNKSYEKRNDKLLFKNISNKSFLKDRFDLIDYYTAYFLENGNSHVSKIIDGDKIYKKYIEKLKNLPNLFEEDIKKLKILKIGMSLIQFKNGNKPLLFGAYIYDNIILETVIILNLVCKNKIFNLWKDCLDTYLQSKLGFMVKYSEYLKYKIQDQLKTFKKITREIL